MEELAKLLVYDIAVLDESRDALNETLDNELVGVGDRFADVKLES